MKHQLKLILAAFALVVALNIAGCGGGGGGGGGSTPTPTPTTTAATDATLVVQLRDPQSAPVDGIVTVAERSLATTNGQVTFEDVPLGSGTARASVNGRTFSQNFNAQSGTTTIQITINPNSNPGDPGDPPPPPF